jgi:hypothetical protein
MNLMSGRPLLNQAACSPKFFDDVHRLVRDNALSRFVISLSVLACLFAIVVWLLYTLKYAPASLRCSNSLPANLSNLRPTD